MQRSFRWFYREAAHFKKDNSTNTYQFQQMQPFYTILLMFLESSVYYKGKVVFSCYYLVMYIYIYNQPQKKRENLKLNKFREN